MSAKKRNGKRRNGKKNKNRELNRKERSRRQQQARATKGKTKALAKAMAGAVVVPDISDDEYTFWLCHGANFLASNYEQGHWEPIFDIYDDERLPTPEIIAQKVMGWYSAEMAQDGPLPPQPRAVLAWTMVEKPEIRIYRYQAILDQGKTAKDFENPESMIRKPYNTVVWAIMNKVRQQTDAVALPELDG